MIEHLEPGTVAFLRRVHDAPKATAPAPALLRPAPDGGFAVYSQPHPTKDMSDMLFAGSLDDCLGYLRTRFTTAGTITHRGGAEITIKGFPSGAFASTAVRSRNDCGHPSGYGPCSLSDCPKKAHA